ncbi:hypothetical protein PC129_g14817 [Phytophthora cactorum]|uniref:Secreted protein n=1 Tax=Phytophthora cactorum TaxID=29920 RepID=A0A8T1LMH6_9STRA|nr:hypothetical protein PC111_g10731 [Phytophthora cactorum]KAG2824251.1 hypothetical protein PC112_g10184 [Phytophthora cactorum]KAG2906207.1 hypothetical protein PC114_g11250 [Phytophthora cactorum]KAG2921207.1 hypothetical protein PC115_g9593 [Phytophthora cactorum]KAG2982099.1 hypothetical protein PC118_g10193 [Phytophthora cactorum]
MRNRERVEDVLQLLLALGAAAVKSAQGHDKSNKILRKRRDVQSTSRSSSRSSHFSFGSKSKRLISWESPVAD